MCDAAGKPESGGQAATATRSEPLIEAGNTSPLDGGASTGDPVEGLTSTMQHFLPRAEARIEESPCPETMPTNVG